MKKLFLFSIFSSVIIFLTLCNNNAGPDTVEPPDAPVLSSPSDGTTGISLSPVLTWNASNGAESYQVQISIQDDFSTTVIDQGGITITSYTASGLSFDTKYYWRVNAQNDGGTSPWSTVWDITTLQDYLLELLPKESQLDSTTLVGNAAVYDTTNLYDLIDGYDVFFYEHGFLRCANQQYSYNNPKLINQIFDIRLNEMRNSDSAKSIYDASLEFMDTAQVISGISDGEAIITQGSWNYECFMHKGKYFINYVGVNYDTTSGAQEAIRAKFVEFCTIFDENISTWTKF